MGDQAVLSRKKSLPQIIYLVCQIDLDDRVAQLDSLIINVSPSSCKKGD